MADLAVIVPTRGRPHLIPRLLDGIARAFEPVDVFLVINDDDTYPEFDAPADHVRVNRGYVAPDLAYPGKLNRAASELHTRYRFLGLFNDDHEPITPGWDVLIKSALAGDTFGVAYGPDGVWEDGQVPTAPVITSTMYAALGWVALPGLHHILVDNVWMDLANGCGTLHFLPDVRIQHHHLDNGEAPMDATYAETQNNEPRNQLDRERWWAWQANGMAADIAKLRALT